LVKFHLISLLFFVGGYSSAQKINGVGFVSNDKPISVENVLPIKKINANYVALNPFALMMGLERTKITFNSKHQWFGETAEGIKQYAKAFKDNDIKIMLKPQIWIMNGEYTGHIKMKSEKDWIAFEKSYSDFILYYAKIAEEIKADIFCIGVELEQFSTHRYNFWKSLIPKIKSIYKGKLTYASNWDEYKKVLFWKQLDFIGVDAYFPLVDLKSPSLNQLKTAWIKHKIELFKTHKYYNKLILFTEYGYRSANYNTKEPWDSKHKSDINLKNQAVALTAIYHSFWSETWFKGGFIWKWHPDYINSGGKNNNRFTPQNKPAEQIIKKVYKGDKV
jgi:hypothetical protein